MRSCARMKRRWICKINDLSMNNRPVFYPGRCSTSPWALLFRRLQKKSLRICSISRYAPLVFLPQRLCPAKAIKTCQHQVWYNCTIRKITPRTPNAKTKPIKDSNFAGIKGMTFSFMEKIAAARAMGEMYSYNVRSFVRSPFWRSLTIMSLPS